MYFITTAIVFNVENSHFHHQAIFSFHSLLEINWNENLERYLLLSRLCIAILVKEKDAHQLLR